MNSIERLTMIAEDYERRAAVQRTEAAQFRTQGRANYVRAAQANARRLEKSAALIRADLARLKKAEDA